MQIKIFTLPLFATEQEQEEVNHFLRSHKVVDVRKELGLNGGNSFWTMFVSYLEGAEPIANQKKTVKVDYRELLDEKTFARFVELRKIRKQIAENEAVPAYVIFTDSELSKIASLDKLDVKYIKTLEGVGESRAEKYGKIMCDLLGNISDETKG